MRNRKIASMVATAALLAAAPSFSASAADLGGNCCADLEERIAELEATTARKGNRKVSLTISGQIAQSIMWWDDGHESNTYQVSNFGNPSYLALAGEAAIAPNWSAGYNFLTYVDDVFSGNTSQLSDDASLGLFMWHNYWWIKSEKLGKIAVGLNSRATDLTPEQDLSGTVYDPSYSLVNDWGFGFLLRRPDGDLVDPANFSILWGNVAGYSFTGETANVVRYDSPTWQGFSFAVSWGEDDMTDVSLFYANDIGAFSVAASVGYAHVTDEFGAGTQSFFLPENPGPLGPLHLETDTWLASASILHNPSGLSVTVAGGQRDYGGSVVVDTDGAVRDVADSSYIYAKLGLITKLNSLGNTNWYAEYGRYWDAISVGASAEAIAGLSISGADACAGGAGQACRAVGSESDVWGIGVVQLVDAASMAFHLGYRHWSGDIDLVDVNGNSVNGVDLEDFHSVMGGARISF